MNNKQMLLHFTVVKRICLFYKFMLKNSDDIKIYFSFIYFEPNGKNQLKVIFYCLYSFKSLEFHFQRKKRFEFSMQKKFHQLIFHAFMKVFPNNNSCVTSEKR